MVSYRVVAVVAGNSEAVTLSGLRADTQYQLVVTAVRAGKKFRSRPIVFRTLGKLCLPKLYLSPASRSHVTGAFWQREIVFLTFCVVIISIYQYLLPWSSRFFLLINLSHKTASHTTFCGIFVCAHFCDTLSWKYPLSSFLFILLINEQTSFNSSWKYILKHIFN